MYFDTKKIITVLSFEWSDAHEKHIRMTTMMFGFLFVGIIEQDLRTMDLPPISTCRENTSCRAFFTEMLC